MCKCRVLIAVGRIEPYVFQLARFAGGLVARLKDVAEGRIDTGYLDRHLNEVLTPPAPPSPIDLAAAAKS